MINSQPCALCLKPYYLRSVAQTSSPQAKLVCSVFLSINISHFTCYPSIYCLLPLTYC